MARTSTFFGRVMLKAFCQKRLKLSFPAPFFGSFFGRSKNEQRIFYGKKKVKVKFGPPKNDQALFMVQRK
jgi:hypothetical protein